MNDVRDIHRVKNIHPQKIIATTFDIVIEKIHQNKDDACFRWG